MSGYFPIIYIKISSDAHAVAWFYVVPTVLSFTFDFDLGVKVTRNVAQYPLLHVTYVPAKFKVASSNGLR